MNSLSHVDVEATDTELVSQFESPTDPDSAKDPFARLSSDVRQSAVLVLRKNNHCQSYPSQADRLARYLTGNSNPSSASGEATHSTSQEQGSLRNTGNKATASLVSLDSGKAKRSVESDDFYRSKYELSITHPNHRYVCPGNKPQRLHSSNSKLNRASHLQDLLPEQSSAKLFRSDSSRSPLAFWRSTRGVKLFRSSSFASEETLAMPSEKGISSWRSRFGVKKGTTESDTDNSLIDRFNLDKRSAGNGEKERLRQEKEGKNADQHSISEHIDRHRTTPINGSIRSGILPNTPLDDYKYGKHNGPKSGSLKGRSKLERMTGERAPPTPAVNPARAAKDISGAETSLLQSSIAVDSQDEQTCPVCLEFLSYRLNGEKPHVVPVCGHALHHACFTAVYGSPESVMAAQNAPGRAQPPGMCGVCRRLIILGEDSGNKRQNKLAGMMGLGSADSNKEQVPAAVDDPLDSSLSPRMNAGYMGQSSSASILDDSVSISTARTIALPTVRARPEYGTVYRKGRDGEQQGNQNVVCVISVEMPARRKSIAPEEDEDIWQQKYATIKAVQESNKEESNKEDKQDDNSATKANDTVASDGQSGGENSQASATSQEQVRASTSEEEEPFSFGATPSGQDPHDPHASVVEDLQTRVVDWKGHSVDRFGALEVYDFLGVRQDAIVREFYVYLFKEALLCVTEEKKKEKGLARLIGSGGDDNTFLSSGGLLGSSKTSLKLKGRIWLRHIRRCENIEQDGQFCLSIKLDDEGLDHFVLCFKEEKKRDSWRTKLDSLLLLNRASRQGDDSLTNGRRKQGHVSPLATPGYLSRRPTATSTSGQSITSGKSGSHGSSRYSQALTSPQSLENGKVAGSGRLGSIPGLPNHQQWSASGGLDPHGPLPELQPHSPIDLVIIVSVPSVANQPSVSSSTLSSSAALKLRLIRSTLDFVISHLGPRDRIALVSYNVGTKGIIRRTALLNNVKDESRDKLEQFVETIGKPWDGPDQDPFLEDIDRLAGNGDRTDTVTAVNVGFDVVLQRKSKNPVTGMILINDTADAPKRGQMDLVMARAEAANVPVHCFGFGKSHDPSSLWLISNHTHGSYTFVKEWYQLRECVAGCVGSIMSVALTDVKLHVSVPSDNHFRVRKVAGFSGAIVSSSGKDVDLDLGELRFGERKELFVELELDFMGLLKQHSESRLPQRQVMSSYEKGSATDDFMQRLGLQGLSITDGSNGDKGKDTLDDRSSASHVDFVDEMAVLEIQCGCRDPSVGMHTSRLPDPCVMTMEVDSTSLDPTADGNGTSGLATALADPVVTRRRLEILVSDMITRSLLLISRRNHHQALTILLETRKIVDTVLQGIPLSPLENGVDNRMPRAQVRNSSATLLTSHRSTHAKRQRELLHRKTALSLLAILEDLDVLIDGLESSKGTSFERSERNFGAQQAMSLRDQKAWTSRTDTEWQFFRSIDNGPPFAALAASFAAYAGR